MYSKLITISIIALILGLSCSNNKEIKPFTPAHLDSVVKNIEDSIIKIEQRKIDSTALSLAITEIEQEQTNTVPVDKPIKNVKETPVVTPAISKDSFEILR